MARRLAAVLAADVVGYSALMSEDENATLAALIAQRNAILEPEIARHSGRIVKLLGDGLLAEFASVVDATACAVAIQTALSRDPTERLKLRIGINLGDVVVEGDDIYGDGVNVAARLEALAKPGGICISGIVQESLGSRAPAGFVAAGEKQLKNIARPVRIFLWSPGVGADYTTTIGPLHMPDKPSIAVLPFTNMSGDPDQDYFSDGLAEDVITELSRFSELFVIARNSSFVFKGQAVDLKEVARRLGVRYLVEGSVRKAGNRVRVSAQLIDAQAGAHLWAERYDRKLEDIFEVQDDVVRAIVAVLPGRIADAGAESSRRKPTGSLTAFDHLLRGNHVLVRRGDSIRKALEHYKAAIGIDPDFAAAYAGIARAEGMSVWDLSTYDDNPLARAEAAACRALELDPNDYRSHAAYGSALRQLGRHALARQHLKRAMALNPNSVAVLGDWAMLQAYTGDPDGAIETFHRAVRLDPFSEENIRKEILAESYYMLRKYSESIAVLEQMLKLPIFYHHQQIAIALAQLGETEAAERHMAQYRASLPQSYDEKLLFESHIRLCEREEDREHWRQGYRLIGMDV
ncbi:tetratricopeptide repeat protein [Limibaculum sp. FT325]|uniref:tetratricopeptide repeat protein n=1 Tax=Thermohalobaculum sediminis TaxID=2939436 RepID=UPI0020BF487C|nr:adenylate/guanylate cyclase domain-containing protein [Limibaculum sediminis]MCL5776411.1 tetratricopeptide repeat protein [Limibaculum sediminis]